MKKALAIIIALILLVGLVGCGGVEFEVNFIVDGEVYSTVGTGGEEIIKMPENPTKEGYTFGGWYWDKDSWKKPFTANSLLDAPLSSDMSVYAKWDAEERGIRFNTLAVEGNNVSGVVSNDTDCFSFVDEIVRNGGAEYVVSFDRAGTKPIPTKTIDLVFGDNSVYITEYVNGDPVTVYTVIIRRRPMYTVSFENHDGTTVDEQVIEEGSLAEAPTQLSRPGYDFDGWDYDLGEPIMGDTVIDAVWTARDDTKYTVEYYLENLDKNGYDKVKTLSLKGVTDTEAVAEKKTFAHFTFNESKSVVSGNIDGEGKLVLRVYYTRDTYKVSTSVNISGGGTVTAGGTYAYGKQIGLTASAPNVGYTFLGIFVDGKRVTESNTYTLTVDKAASVEARFEVRAEMSNFKFTSTTTTCEITGIKDKTVKNIVVPDYVTSIGGGAFSGCSSLESITLPFVGGSKKSASDTYQYPFGYIFGTSNYTGGVSTTQYYYGSSTSSTTSTTYYIPSSLKTVTITGGNMLRGAFSYCTGLKSVTIGSGVTSMGYSAFAGCTGLKSITILNGVKSIGDYAFSGCTGLTSVTIGSGVTSIGSDAFENCTGLNAVHISDIAAWCKISFGNAYANPLYYAKNLYLNGKLVTELVIPDGVTSIGSWAFDDCTGLVSVTIPSSVTSIGYSAFRYCTGLKSVTIPNSVTSIGNYAFYNCTSLTSITIPNSVTSIGPYAFRNCTGLKSVTIGSGVESIGDYAFYNCTGLTSITIPNSVTSIGSSAFEDCTGLNAVHISDIAAWCKISFGNAYANPLYYAKNLYLNGKLVTELVIPDGVTSIGSWAFYNCNGLESVTIGSDVKSIGSSAFSGCIGLKSVTIPNSVTSIGNYAFRNCTGLTGVTIPDSVTSIGEGAFSGCSSLKSITLPFVGGSKKSASDTYQYPFGYIFGTSSYDGGVSTTQPYYGSSTSSSTSTTYYIPSSLKTVTITGGNILYGAFYNCSGLTSVTITDSVTSIGKGVFSGCSSLESITLPFVGASKDASSSTHFGYIFGASSYGYNEQYVPSSLRTVVITGGTSIGSYAFRNCTRLTSVTISNSVRSIGSYAFRNCTGLTSITIPDSVTGIGDYAFYDCTSLTSVTIGSGVRSIGYWAFSGCTRLSSVTIGSGVRSIGDKAFEDCTGLTSINYRGTQEQWNAISKGSSWNYNTGSYTVKYNYTGE